MMSDTVALPQCLCLTLEVTFSRIDYSTIVHRRWPLPARHHDAADNDCNHGLAHNVLLTRHQRAVRVLACVLCSPLASSWAWL